MSRKAGNPNWGKPEVNAVPTITEFEKMVLELNLTPDQFVASLPLREWVAKNKNVRYVPEPLLEAWGFGIDSSF
jgi:hypothetical protein